MYKMGEASHPTREKVTFPVNRSSRVPMMEVAELSELLISAVDGEGVGRVDRYVSPTVEGLA
jgi:hypothetical protein